MLKASEIGSIILVTIVLGFVVSFTEWKITLNTFLMAMLFIFIIIILNFLAKKYTAYLLDSNIETSIWKWQRYWFYEKSYFRKPLPMGIILPFVLSIFSAGYVQWLASLEFEVAPSLSRISKRHGLYRFSEMTEFHIALIAASGIFITLFLSIIAYIAGFSELARLSIFFACWNMLPISSLDGSKIFFGSIVLWVFLAILCLIGLGYAWFLV